MKDFSYFIAAYFSGPTMLNETWLAVNSDNQKKTVEAYLSRRNVFVSALTGAGISSTFGLARIFRTTVSFLSAQSRHKRFVIVNLRHWIYISFPAINSRFNQALVNFRLNFFFVITLVQSKQICSFDRRRRNAHTFDYFVDQSGHWVDVASPVASYASPHFWRETQMTVKWKPLKRDKSTFRDFVARGL